jgi:hypothetical protein
MRLEERMGVLGCKGIRFVKKKTGEPHHRPAGTQIEVQKQFVWLDDSAPDHDRGRITGTVPSRLPTAGLSGKSEVIEVFVQELVIELREKTGCR